jgi:hypothetical protein
MSFVSGIYFCATHQVHIVDVQFNSPFASLKESFDPAQDLQGPTTIDCPDMLIKSGNSLLLYNSRHPEQPGVNPFPFYNLDEYINYLDEQRKKGIHCPVLFVQEENNTQGQSVFRVRPDVFQTQGGLPTQNSIVNPTPPMNQPPIQITDANREREPWNQNQHAGFDPTGQFIGRYTTLDALHDSTYKGQSLSENPMDDNWGGVIYTKTAVDSGKYEEREVLPPSQSGPFREKTDNIRDLKKSSQLSIFA